MKIKILKCSDSMFWYNKYIGSVVEIRRRDLMSGCWWVGEIPGGFTNFVLFKDAEVITDDK